MLGDDTMTTASTARCCLLLAGMLGFALTAVAAQAQSQPATASAAEKNAKRAKAVQGKAGTAHGAGQHTADKTDADQPDMIMLQEPFRPGPATPVSVTRGR